MAPSTTLPAELLELIILTFWNFSTTSTNNSLTDFEFLSLKDRATFIKSSLLVHPIWQDLFLGVYSKDPFIPSSNTALKLVEALNAANSDSVVGSSSTELNSTPIPIRLATLLQMRCSRITFQYDDNPSNVIVVNLTSPPSSPMSSSSSSSSRLMYLANKISHHNTLLLSRIEETQLQLQALTLTKEKWSRVIQARGVEDTRKALGLSNNCSSSCLRNILSTICGLKRKFNATAGPDMEDEVRDRLGELVGKEKLIEDEELEKAYLEKWLWVIEEEKN